MSEASETVSGVDNAKLGICYMYVCMYVWYVCPLNARAGNFFSPKNTAFLGLTPVYSETTALSKPYFILKLRSVRKFLQKRFFFKKQKVDSTGYYGIEDPFPDLISKLRRFLGGYGVAAAKSILDFHSVEKVEDLARMIIVNFMRLPKTTTATLLKIYLKPILPLMLMVFTFMLQTCCH